MMRFMDTEFQDTGKRSKFGKTESAERSAPINRVSSCETPHSLFLSANEISMFRFFPFFPTAASLPILNLSSGQ